MSSDKEAWGEDIVIKGDCIAIKLPSKAFWFKTFDILFIFTYAVGWLITYFKYPDFLNDNAALRAFGMNNVCVGIDFGLARTFAIVMYAFWLFPLGMFAYTSYVHMRLYGMSPTVLQVNKILLIVGCICTSFFGWTYGIQPLDDDLTSVYLHTWGFCIGSIGYALLRVVEAVSFCNQYPRPWTSKQHVYFCALIFFVIWISICPPMLLRSLLFDDLAARLLIKPTNVNHFTMGSIQMWVWTVVILTLPIATWALMPEVLNSVHLVESSHVYAKAKAGGASAREPALGAGASRRCLGLRCPLLTSEATAPTNEEEVSGLAADV